MRIRTVLLVVLLAIYFIYPGDVGAVAGLVLAIWGIAEFVSWNKRRRDGKASPDA
jgi:hypothetical protein